VPLSVMDIRKMNVFVNHGFVPVRVGMRFDTTPDLMDCFWGAN